MLAIRFCMLLEKVLYAIEPTPILFLIKPSGSL